MNIHIAQGTGYGETKLAAFDSALYIAGVANYNLIRLSSVIPPGTTIITHNGTIDRSALPGGWGDRLYVVMAERRTNNCGEKVCAGIGWIQDPETKKGLFVEHDGCDEVEVAKEIELSLKRLAVTRGVDFGLVHMKVETAQCTDKPVCALVVAAYQASDWENHAYFNA